MPKSNKNQKKFVGSTCLMLEIYNKHAIGDWCAKASV
jgi:hypothetical protein